MKRACSNLLPTETTNSEQHVTHLKNNTDT